MNTEPTPAQAEAGNYKKGHITIGEFDITIENPAGSVRKGVDADGKEWQTTMSNTYGYIKGTEGVDGDHIDVFLHSDMDQWDGRKAFVVDQTGTDGSFDEHKVMLGFNDKDEAMSAYLANYDADWAQTHPGLRISETGIEDFNKWVESSHRKTKPFADYSTVSKVTDDAPVENRTSGGYTITPTTYTNKKGKTSDMFLVKFDRELTKDEQAAAKGFVDAQIERGRRTKRGWYDYKEGGYMLRQEEDAKRLAEMMGENDFRGSLRWVEKEKVLSWLAPDSYKNSDMQDDQKPFDIAKIVNDFENPRIEGDDSVADLANLAEVEDVRSDVDGAATSAEAKSGHARRLGEKLGTKVRLVNADEVDDLPSRRQRRAKGWYDERTGEVVVVVPNHADAADVAATVFHEVVAHKGLRELVGEENYDAFCDEVYDHLKDDLKEEVDREATRRFEREPEKGYEHHRRVAVDEMFGRMAEKGFEDFTKAERGIWAKLKAKVLEAINKFLGSLKLPKWVKLGDNELRYMLWRSHEKLRSKGDYVDMARDAAKRNELGLSDEVRYAMGDKSETFKERQARAVLEVGVVMPGLNEGSVNVVNVGKHPFDGANPIKQAREWAKKNIVGTHSAINSKGQAFEYVISNAKIDKYLSQSAIEKSDNLGIHLSVLTKLPEIIGESVEAEVHPDYGKDENGKRSVHGKINPQRLIYRFYGAAQIGGKVYRVKTTMQEFKDDSIANTPHGFEVTKIELLPEGDNPMNEAQASTSSRRESTLGTAKLLKDVEKSYEKGVKLLESSGIGGDIRFRSVSNGAARQEYDERVRTMKKKQPGDKKAEKPTNRFAQLHEAYLDGMRSLRVLQEAIGHETGEPIESHEDAYEFENQLSSRNKIAEEEYEREYLKPMFDAIADICKGKEQKDKYKELVDYVFAKHGLERNAFMRQRDIVNGVDQGQADSTDYAGLTALTGEDDVADAEAKAAGIVTAYESAVDTSALWQSINAATKATLTTRYTSGLLSRDMYDTIRIQYKNYVPMKGWEDTVAADVYEYAGGGYGIGSALMRANGRKSVADDPFATIVADAQRTIMEANRNVMKQRFLNLALNHPTDLLTVNKQWYVKQADGTWLPDNPIIPVDADADLVDAIVKQHEADMEALESKGEAENRRAGLQLGLNTTGREPSQHVVKVKRNGEEFCIYINGDPRAARAINGILNPDAGDKTKMAVIAQEVKNFMAKVFTTWNPEFVVGNLSRDLMFAGTAVAVKEDKKYTAKYTRNITEIMAKASLPRLLWKWEHGTLDDNVDVERYFKEFLRNGGETGFTQLNTVDKVKKEMQRFIREAQGGVEHLTQNVWREFWNGVEFMNRSAEDTTRFAVYMTSRQMGRTISRSVSDAKDITVNFNRKGSGAFGARQLNFLYVFFNACVQSIGNAGRLVKNNPWKASAAMATFLSAGFLVPLVSSVFSAMFGGDDDAYWNLPEWVRRNNLCLYVPFTEKWLTIPIAHELRPFYGIGEISYSVMNGQETVEDGLLKGVEAFSGLMPVDYTGNGGDNVVNFAPTIAQPLVQIERNVDYFGKPIYKKTPWNEDEPEWTKAYKGTNGMLVDLSKMLSEANATTDEFGVKSYPKHWYTGDVNPAIVEHLVESYTGGLGKTVNGFSKTLSMLWDEDARELRNVPIGRKLLQSTDERYVELRTREQFFKLKTEYEEDKKYLGKLKANAKDGVFGAEENISKWAYSDEGKRYMMLDRYMKAIKNIEDDIRNVADEGHKNMLKERADSMKVQLFKEYESMQPQ